MGGVAKVDLSVSLTHTHTHTHTRTRTHTHLADSSVVKGVQVNAQEGARDRDCDGETKN